MQYEDLFVDMRIDSFCDGRFGREGYGPHAVVAWGWNWLVVRVNTDYLDITEFDSNDAMMRSITEWMNEEE